MALIPKRTKKGKSKDSETSVIPFQWKVFKNGEQYSLFVDDTDIADRVVANYLNDDDMVAYDPESGFYFLLWNAEGIADDEMQNGHGYKSNSGALVVTYNNFEDYYFLYLGEHKGDEFESFWSGDNLLFWNPAGEEYYFTQYNRSHENNLVFIPELLEFTNGTLWVKEDDTHFKLIVNGVDISEDVTAEHLDNDILICNEDSRMYYVFRDWEYASPYVPYTAEILNQDSSLLWAKTGNGEQYSFYIKGEKADVDQWTANFIDDDVVLFRPDTGEHYLLPEFKNVEQGELYPPRLLPNNTVAVWARTSEKGFVLFVRGENLSSEVETQLMDGNLMLFHKATNTIYIATQYHNQQLYDYQPAVLMDANELM